MMKAIYALFISALLLAFTPPFTAQAEIPHADAKQDHATCVKNGFILGNAQDPMTENYYNCRAEIATAHIIKLQPPATRLSAEEIRHNQLMAEVAKNFTEKAQASRQFRINGSETSIRNWEDKQSADAKRLDRDDHQRCVSAGYEPTSWGNPDTEQYYLCRASIIEQRAPSLPGLVKGNNKRVPGAALYFYRKAKEAQYAFRAVNYETHQLCMSKGFLPGELEDKKTEQYYACRAELAQQSMGKKVAESFRQRAIDAARSASEAQPCINKGYKKGMPVYAQCRKAVVQYKQCMAGIENKLKQQKQPGDQECRSQAELQFPSELSRSREKRVTMLDQYGRTSTTIVQEKALFNAKEIHASRQQAYKLCRQRTAVDPQTLAISLRLQCGEIMDFDKPK